MQSFEKDPKRSGRAIQFHFTNTDSQDRVLKLVSAGRIWPLWQFCIQTMVCSCMCLLPQGLWRAN